MSVLQAPAVILTPQEHHDLLALIKAHRTPQDLVLRARIIIAASFGTNNSKISRDLGITLPTTRVWRQRWLSRSKELSVTQRLADLPRSGAPCRISEEQVNQIKAVACEVPSASGHPITHWSGRELANEVIKRGIVDHVSERHVQRLLKKGGYNRTSAAIGSTKRRILRQT